jgi:excinuclease ABC subunit C
MIGRDTFVLEGVSGEADSAVLTNFLLQFYEGAQYVPTLVAIPSDADDREAMEELLTEKRAARVEIRVPERGEKRRLVQLACENAKESLDMLRVKWLADRDKTAMALDQLREELSLPEVPQRIECYDNSNIQGTSPVASMVVFIDGKPKTQEYRRFRIKTVVGANDFASMAEILGRRFKRWENSNGDGGQVEFVEGSEAAYEAVEDPASRDALERRAVALSEAGPRDKAPLELRVAEGRPVLLSAATDDDFAHDHPEPVEGPDDPAAREDEDLLGWGALPDLVIVDGGKGQLSAALDVMRNLGLAHVPLAGLAKQNEELFVQDQAEPIILPRTSQALYLVQRIRDEAHRFAITYHRQVRAKSAIQSALDNVPGVGPKRKRALLRKFGSVKGVREATVEEIAITVGFTVTLAAKVKEHL